MVDTRGEYQELFNIYWPIGVGVFLVVAFVIAFAVVRYRSRDDEFREAKSQSRAEELYAGGLVLITAALLFFTYTTMDDLDAAETGNLDAAELEGEVLDVDVTAARWTWRFDYPEQDITETGTNTTPATLVVPAGTPVRFHLTSLDVQHSFFIPELRFKRDALPQVETVFALEFQDVGLHQQAGECAEFCGLRHSYMDFNVDVKEPEDFENWVEQRQAAGAELELPAEPTPSLDPPDPVERTQ